MKVEAQHLWHAGTGQAQEAACLSHTQACSFLIIKHAAAPPFPPLTHHLSHPHRLPLRLCTSCTPHTTLTVVTALTAMNRLLPYLPLPI